MTDTPPPQNVRWSGMTHPGKVRANNEDTFLALNFDATEVRYLGKFGESTTDRGDYVFAVSDGMGGAKSGEFASKIATEKITRLLPLSFKQSAHQIAAGQTEVLTELMHRIHDELIKLGRYYDECRGMGATLSLGWFTPSWMLAGALPCIADLRSHSLACRACATSFVWASSIARFSWAIGWPWVADNSSQRRASFASASTPSPLS